MHSVGARHFGLRFPCKITFSCPGTPARKVTHPPHVGGAGGASGSCVLLIHFFFIFLAKEYVKRRFPLF